MKVLVVFGTRPEAIKLAPVVWALRRRSGLVTRICVTGQHRAMLDQVLGAFDIRPDHDLALMHDRQDLARATARSLVGLRRILSLENPDWVVVQGDTTTALAGALAAVCARVRLGHVEAGLRTGDLTQPWPEEANRRVIDSLADVLWPPTEAAKDNLLRENLGTRHIIVTGNTGVDALLQARTRLLADGERLGGCRLAYPFANDGRRLLLVTAHRRESFGPGLARICDALRQLARRDDIVVAYAAHLNPRVYAPVVRRLAGLANVHVIEPVPYLDFVYLMDRCHFVLTDSGGIQEEAPVLGRPVLVMREVTERRETIEAGTTQLVGTDPDRICHAAIQLLDDSERYGRMSRPHSPFGDGRASELIVDHLCQLSGLGR